MNWDIGRTVLVIVGVSDPQQRLQHRLEPAWRCRRLMGGGTLDRLRAKSGFTDLRSFLQ